MSSNNSNRVVFYTEDDASRARETGELYLGFCSMGVDLVTQAVGLLVQDALLRAGLKPHWSGLTCDRIGIDEFEWKQRRPITQPQIAEATQ